MEWLIAAITGCVQLITNLALEKNISAMVTVHCTNKVMIKQAIRFYVSKVMQASSVSHRYKCKIGFGFYYSVTMLDSFLQSSKVISIIEGTCS